MTYCGLFLCLSFQIYVISNGNFYQIYVIPNGDFIPTTLSCDWIPLGGCFKKPTDLSEEELVEKISKQQAKRGQEDVKMGAASPKFYHRLPTSSFSMFFNLTFSALISCLYF